MRESSAALSLRTGLCRRVWSGIDLLIPPRDTIKMNGAPLLRRVIRAIGFADVPSGTQPSQSGFRSSGSAPE